MYHYGYQLENELFLKGIEGESLMQIWIALAIKSKFIMDIGQIQ